MKNIFKKIKRYLAKRKKINKLKELIEDTEYHIMHRGNELGEVTLVEMYREQLKKLTK